MSGELVLYKWERDLLVALSRSYSRNLRRNGHLSLQASRVTARDGRVVESYHARPFASPALAAIGSCQGCGRTIVAATRQGPGLQGMCGRCAPLSADGPG